MLESDIIFQEVPAAPIVCALIVNDSVSVSRGLAAAITALGGESAICTSAAAAVAALDEHRPDIIFLDVSLRQSEAISFLETLRARSFTGIVQLMSGGGQLQLAHLIEQFGTRDDLCLRAPIRKPYRLTDIRAAISDAVAHGRAGIVDCD